MSLCISAVSPEPSLFAHMKYGNRRRVWPKIRHLAPLDGCACTFEEWIYGGQNVIISWAGSFYDEWINLRSYEQQCPLQSASTETSKLVLTGDHLVSVMFFFIQFWAQNCTYMYMTLSILFLCSYPVPYIQMRKRHLKSESLSAVEHNM